MAKNYSRPKPQISAETVEVIKVQNRTKVLTSLFKYSCYCALGYFAYLTIDSLAGKTTVTEFFVSVFGNISINKWLAYVIGAGGMGYGVLQRKLRQKNIKRLTKQITELEKIVNRKRKSSNLSEIGKTPN